MLFSAELSDTALAYLLVLEDGKFLATAAEMAGRKILLNNDAVALARNLNGVGILYAKLLSELLGYYDAAKLIDVSDNSGVFQNNAPFFNWFCFVFTVKFYHIFLKKSSVFVKIRKNLPNIFTKISEGNSYNVE